MQKEWTSYRKTLLLYFIIILLPFGFYFIYTSFQTMNQDTNIVPQSCWITGAIKHSNSTGDRREISAINRSFDQISLWVQHNNASDLYIGRNTLAEDFKEVKSCWLASKKEKNIDCYDVSNSLAIVIEKMVYLKQKKIINIFYMSLALTMIFIVLLIYMIRTYIHIQMKKHAIHDHETTLFNKKYFLSELKSTAARSIRHEYPLSILHIRMEGFEKGSTQYDKKTKLQTLKAFGTLMHSLIREGDLPARYDENHFLMLLPFTNKENALLFEKRIIQSTMEEECIMSEKIKLHFTVTEFDKKESREEFMQRTLAN